MRMLRIRDEGATLIQLDVSKIDGLLIFDYTAEEEGLYSLCAAMGGNMIQLSDGTFSEMHHLCNTINELLDVEFLEIQR